MGYKPHALTIMISNNRPIGGIMVHHDRKMLNNFEQIHSNNLVVSLTVYFDYHVVHQEFLPEGTIVNKEY